MCFQALLAGERISTFEISDKNKSILLFSLSLATLEKVFAIM